MPIRCIERTRDNGVNDEGLSVFILNKFLDLIVILLSSSCLDFNIFYKNTLKIEFSY